MKTHQRETLITLSFSITLPASPCQLCFIKYQENERRNVGVTKCKVWLCYCRSRQIAGLGGEPNEDLQKQKQRDSTLKFYDTICVYVCICSYPASLFLCFPPFLPTLPHLFLFQLLLLLVYTSKAG